MPKKPAKPKPFATEADLCAAFIKAVGKEWTAYNECEGWDILLVRAADGFQIGIQAKLRFNVDVINQALEKNGRYSADRPGPDCRAVLVPEGDGGGFDRICAYVGLTIIRMPGPRRREKGVIRYGSLFRPDLPERDDWYGEWFEMAPAKRHKLPEYVPDVRAGASAPVQLTDWKIKALKIAVLLEVRGSVLRSDFTHLHIDHRRWIAGHWLRPSPTGYVAGRMPDFRAQHPRVYEEIKADIKKWAPASFLDPPPMQLVLTP